MVIAYTGAPDRVAAIARRLRLQLDDVVTAAPPGRFWWLVPPADLLGILAELDAGAELLVADLPSSPLVNAVLEEAARAQGVRVHLHPKLPRWILDPIRLAVLQARPESWEEIASVLYANGHSVRAITAEIARRVRAGELREGPSRSTLHRFLNRNHGRPE